MKLDFGSYYSGLPASREPWVAPARVVGETDPLTDVVLCAPHYLAPVPCCDVTRQSLAAGFATSTQRALAQHAALVELLEARGVRCHGLPASPDLPDMCFTRDVAVATPFGLVALNPALPHRQAEVATLVAAGADWGVPVRRLAQGTLEGGDVCVAREGVLIVGMSGERSSRAGVDAFAAPFRNAGWAVIVCPFAAAHLHLDTIFCMVSPTEAIGCVDLLDPGFLAALAAQGIRVLPVPTRAAASLGCNILALGDRRIVASTAEPAVAATLHGAGYAVDSVDISEFAACGGGIHCLTMPLRRRDRSYAEPTRFSIWKS